MHLESAILCVFDFRRLLKHDFVQKAPLMTHDHRSVRQHGPCQSSCCRRPCVAGCCCEGLEAYQARTWTRHALKGKPGQALSQALSHAETGFRWLQVPHRRWRLLVPAISGSEAFRSLKNLGSNCWIIFGRTETSALVTFYFSKSPEWTHVKMCQRCKHTVFIEHVERQMARTWSNKIHYVRDSTKPSGPFEGTNSLTCAFFIFGQGGLISVGLPEMKGPAFFQIQVQGPSKSQSAHLSEPFS